MNPGPSASFDTVPIAPREGDGGREDISSWGDAKRVAGSFAQDKMDGPTAAIMDDPLQQDSNTQPVVPAPEPVLPQVCFVVVFILVSRYLSISFCRSFYTNIREEQIKGNMKNIYPTKSWSIQAMDIIDFVSNSFCIPTF